MGNEVKTMKVSLIFLPQPRMFRRAGLIFFLLLLCTASCNTVDPPPDNTVLNLTLEDVSCTEAWITLTANNLQLPATLNLLKDNTITKTINLQTADTLLYIDSLLPNQTYKYQVSSIQHPVFSNELSVTTLDTTSHNFTWQTWTFGELSAGASGLFDVALIDDNNIYAVGRITSLDSLGNPDPNLYNAVHWDGIEWELKRILYKGGFWVIRTIFAFSENDIWLSCYIRYQNGQFIELTIPDLLIGWGINKLWGRSSSDLYAVGNAGNIAHWNGSKWTKIESNITDNIQSIYGAKNSTGEYEILSIASEEFTNVPTTLMKIDPQSNNVKKITGHNLPFAMKDIWFRPYRKYIAVGNGIYSAKNLEGKDGWKREVSAAINTWYSIAIDGEDFNDIVVCGAAGELLHYNGWNWENLTSQIGINGINRLAECKIKNGVIVSVGFTLNGEGIIILGRRS
jgi:hypothetical protein